MQKNYQFIDSEPAIRHLWDEKQVNKPETQGEAVPTGQTFSIIMPPPNANDPLHVGHAMFVTIEDIFIRFHRMLGDTTLWLPGADHAGIETQFVFEKKLQKEGKSRFNFDRKTLYQMIWDYVQENADVAVSQMKQLGASADWSRFAFTLDPIIVEKVRDTFYRLHADNLIYRDQQLVNYCTHCGTSYSELEVKYVERQDPLYYIKYGPFEVATVRPETKFGDVALAVHPDDERYAKYVGQTVTIEDVNGEMQLPVIADEMVDREFGTGVVKITPAHDPNDFQASKRHNLPSIQVVNTRGKLTEQAGQFAGLSVAEGRKQVAAALEAKGLLSRPTDTAYTHNVGTCYRCGRVIEPLPIPQFFLKVNNANKSLVARVERMLDQGEVKIHGAGREQILRNWLSNLRDWNISRQIVWGIRIPVWYNARGHEENITVSYLNPEGQYVTNTLAQALTSDSLEHIAANLQSVFADAQVPYSTGETKPEEEGLWIPETDTFDTWFSSGQWPVVTLKRSTEDFAQFYPTTVMETGYDILPFWVMRMMLLCGYLTDKSPFFHVYLHGLIRDSKGQKMSKSKGNGINPLDVAAKYGVDTLRMALVIRSTAGQDKNIGEPDFIAGRNFLNKLWNAARFITMQEDGQDEKSAQVANDDSAFNAKLDAVVLETTTLLHNLKPGLAADILYDSFWHWFCDEAIEAQKKGKISLAALNSGLLTFLKLLHPFIPHVTEQIWQELRAENRVKSEVLALSAWPTPDARTT